MHHCGGLGYLGYMSCSSALPIHLPELCWQFLKQSGRLREIASRSRPALACNELLRLGFKSLQTQDYGGGKYWGGLGTAVLVAAGSVAFPFSR